MKTVKFLKLAASTLILSSAMIAGGTVGIANSHSTESMTKQEKIASRAAQKSAHFLAKQKFDKALANAELAVSMKPESAEYRALLGQAYLRTGRLQSAETAFHDSLTLQGGRGRVALNLALTQIANGKPSDGMATLDANRDAVSPSDYGLAIALAGDVSRGVSVLEAASRGPDADAKARQNLALAYAMAGQWANARVMAAQDLSLDLVDARMTQWASFVRPRAAWDQVASLMKITPTEDSGMPGQLALNVAPAPQAVAAIAAPEPVTAPPQQFAEAQPVYETPVAAAPVVEPEPSVPAFVPLPKPHPVHAAAPLIKSNHAPIKQAVVVAPKVAPSKIKPVKVATVKVGAGKVVAVKPLAKPIIAASVQGASLGGFVVQLGAFSNEGSAQAAWNGVLKKTAEIGNFSASSARVKVKGASLYRLSVSGFVTKEAAGQVCVAIKSAGGACFVRSVSGDAPLQWASTTSANKIAARR
jgi:Flp pilus assembly protein TadD